MIFHKISLFWTVASSVSVKQMERGGYVESERVKVNIVMNHEYELESCLDIRLTCVTIFMNWYCNVVFAMDLCSRHIQQLASENWQWAIREIRRDALSNICLVPGDMANVLAMKLDSWWIPNLRDSSKWKHLLSRGAGFSWMLKNYPECSCWDLIG